MKVLEKVFSFGTSGSLHGVLAEPEPGARIEGAPAVITWNVGLHHHVGPHRYYVDLGRALADSGFTSLRFDISGLGDSEVSRDDARPDPERAMSDVREAMSALASQRGFERFVLVGFCSGVDAAHAVSAVDPRVVGTIYLEGYGFRTHGYYLRYPRRLLNRDRWERLLRLKYPKLFGEPASVGGPGVEREAVYLRDYPTREKLRADLLRMVDRGTRLLLIYVGGDTDYVYRDQFFAMLGGLERDARIDVEFYPDADHTFFLEEDRVKSILRITQWMRDAFGAERGGRAGAYEQRRSAGGALT